MVLVAALGNPGKKYADTKHNFGFWVADRLADRHTMSFRAGKGSYVYAGSPGSFMIVKPTTFMNNSGLAVSEACRYFNIDFGDVLLVYDDIDLPLGTIRFRSAGGAGGHRGVESVIYHLRTENFPRLRLGIATDKPMRPAERYVLRPFDKNSEKRVPDTVDRACDGIDYFMKHGIVETMNQFNGKGLV